jgi:tetratricopeptide (TPR) repeat protein
VDADVRGTELEKGVFRELSTLRAEAAEQAAKHLVMTGRLLDEDPEAAYEHAMAARQCGPRVAVIREAVGIAAYTSGRWAEALAELRTARRISGDDEHWPMMADCERALGRPEKALAMASAPEVRKLSKASLIEMRIVAAGARADLGQLDAAVVTLQTADLNATGAPWLPRLRFAYAAALEAVGRRDEARQWYAKAAEVDPEGETDAAERLQELDGIRFYDEAADADESVDQPRDAAGSAEPAPPARAAQAARPDASAEAVEVESPDASAEAVEVEPSNASAEAGPAGQRTGPERDPFATAEPAMQLALPLSAPTMPAGGLFLDAALPAGEPADIEDEEPNP